ncbi:MAG: hypothetical protein QMB82_05620, partial [Bacteroidales bacterium]
MIDDFFNTGGDDELEDITRLVDLCLEAFNSGSLTSLRFTEEEFDLLINHFLNEAEDQILYDLSRMAYEQHPY